MDHIQSGLDRIWRVFSGEAAWQAVADLSRFHRIQASPGFRRAAEWLHGQLLAAGLGSEIHTYRADHETRFWATSSFQEWEASAATLDLIEPAEEATRLADYRAMPLSLIQRSSSFEGEAEVVALSDGLEDGEYEGLDVSGKVVLTRGDVRRVRELAVEKHGAVGILFDGLRAVPPVRREGDLPDIRQYSSFWWQPGDIACFGFVLTPRQGRAVRRLLDKGEAPVRVRAKVESRLYDGAFEVVSATIPGSSDQEVVVVAHLCHPQPSANDNASGAAAALEAARALHSLIAAGRLPMPMRTIRFLWLPEMTGSYAYLADPKTDRARFVAGINLDMVGQSQDQTGSAWLIERPPEAAASFAPDLLACLRDQMTSIQGMPDVAPSHTGMGGYPLYRLADVPFSGGSDHYVFSDPTVGVPMPMLIQWPDRFYHTSADSPDRTDPASLARAGTLAAAYALWIASAGTLEATWLGYEMLARFKGRLAQTAQAIVSKAMAVEDQATLAEHAARLDRRLAYLLDRQKAALRSLERLAPVKCLEPGLLAEAEQAYRHELAWAKGAIELHNVSLPHVAETGKDLVGVPSLSEDDELAMSLVPERIVPGPIGLQDHLRRLGAEERERWRKLIEARKDGAHHTLLPLALYWADGRRSILEIADLVEMEAGRRDVELVLNYYQLLGKLELVMLHGPG